MSNLPPIDITGWYLPIGLKLGEKEMAVRPTDMKIDDRYVYDVRRHNLSDLQRTDLRRLQGSWLAPDLVVGIKSMKLNEIFFVAESKSEDLLDLIRRCNSTITVFG